MRLEGSLDGAVFSPLEIEAHLMALSLERPGLEWMVDLYSDSEEADWHAVIEVYPDGKHVDYESTIQGNGHDRSWDNALSAAMRAVLRAFS